MAEEEKRIYPGELLKAARKKKRLRYKRLSSELGISEKYIEALEENNFSIMAGPAYVRGYLRAYSKKLDLDPDLTIAAFDNYLRDQSKQKKKIVKKERKEGRKIKFFYAFIVFISLIIFTALLIFVIPERSTFSEKKKDIDSYAESEIQDLTEKLTILESEKKLIMEQDPFEHPLNINIQKKAVLMETPKFIVEEVNNQKITEINTIEIMFSGDCWIEIMEGKRTLEYKLAKAGSSITVKGKGPFKLLVGNSKTAELFYNGSKVSLGSNTNVKTNVSCLVLPEGRCSEFALSN